MKVILTEDVRGAGKKGQVIDVKDGHGRNFLIPRGLALPATEGNIKRFENIVKNLSSKKGRGLKVAEDIKVKLEDCFLNIKKKAGMDGKLFGSVTPKDIVDAVKKILGVEIDKKHVKIDEPIKMTGAYIIDVHLGQDINAKVKIEVEKKE